MIRSLLKRRQADGARTELDEQVRQALVGTLFASPISLAVGALVGAMISISIAWSTADRGIIAVAICLTVVGAWRVFTAIAFQAETRAKPAGSRQNWEMLYEIGGWTHAGLLGVMTFLALTQTDQILPQLLAATASTGYAAGISGRNGGRPFIAIGQVWLAAFPMTVALCFVGTPLGWILAFANLLFAFGQTDIVLKMYRVFFNVFSSKQEKADLADRYEKLASCDPLTGLDNRSTLDRRLTKLLAEEPDRSLAVIWIDLDRFKEVNDTLGHSVGDLVLLTTAERLTRIIGERGWPARFGGDEFVILYRLDRGEDMRDLGTTLLEAISRPIDVDGVVITVTASIGGAVSSADGTEAAILLKHADMALYHAKKQARGTFSVFHDSMQDQLLARREMENDLRLALEAGDLELFYQPVVDLATGTISSCEALLRWHHPVRGAISPAEFIPLAEATGLIAPLTDFVLEQACAAAMRWPDGQIVSVNISPILLRRPDFFTKIVSVLYKSGLPAHRLELEITETVMVEDSPQANFMLKELRRIGLRLALDDFGTGFSSLSYLLTYSFDRIKIDRSFVMNLGRSREAGAIIRSIVSLASALSVDTVAEGVETEEQLENVRAMGCTSVQGFLFARPMSERNVAEHLSAHRKPGPLRSAPRERAVTRR